MSGILEKNHQVVAIQITTNTYGIARNQSANVAGGGCSHMIPMLPIMLLKDRSRYGKTTEANAITRCIGTMHVLWPNVVLAFMEVFM